MFGTFKVLGSPAPKGQEPPFLTASDSVLAALALSAVVTAGASYVALEYMARPFVTSAARAPLAITRGPDLGLPESPGPALDTPQFADTAPEFPVLATLPVPNAGPIAQADLTSALRPAQVVYGQPDVAALPRPSQRDLLLAFAPTPRPGTAIPPAARELVAVDGAAQAASTFQPQEVAPGLQVSLIPAPRPDSLAAVVASARQQPAVELASSVEVARAEASDVEVAPARLELPSLGPIRTAGNPCHGRLTRGIPSRPRSAPGGSEVMAALAGTGGTARDAQILAAAMGGNVPDFLRNLRPVSFSGTTSSGQEAVVTICVTPDYLAVGSDSDFVRVPLGLTAALQVADAFDMMLPTTRMVDAIYAQADLRLNPQPMTPGAEMVSTNYFLRHSGLVDEQMARAGGRLGLLVAGQKKDVVIANRMSSNPGRVAIYGWHRASGSPIQPLSTVHGAEYADYSHGIRLVSRTAFVNGQAVDLGALLTDARYAAILNSDGALTGRIVQTAALR